MLVSAHQARTSLAITLASSALIAALLLSPQGRAPEREPAPTSRILSARLTSTEILGGEQDIAVTIEMPRRRERCGVLARPPLSLAIVIDRSGSMEGEPLANAKAAAQQLVDQLRDGDAFTIIAYSSQADLVVPIERATPASKAAAREVIERITDDGNTCISCGIEIAAASLEVTPNPSGVRRMVLISDGQANMGRHDRNDLAQLATETAAPPCHGTGRSGVCAGAAGVSISTVGVGLDFDEITMTRIADVGRGRYYFVEDTAQLGTMFERELAALSDTVATDARLVITDAAGVIEDAYGYPVIREGNQVIVPIADLRDGEKRKVVLRASVDATRTGKLTVAHFALHWRRVSDGAFDQARTRLDTKIVRSAARVQATIDRAAVNIVEQARTARILEHATTVYETHGQAAAQRVIERNLRGVRGNMHLDAPSLKAIESASTTAIDNFATAPRAKAMKATRADAYQLAH